MGWYAQIGANLRVSFVITRIGLFLTPGTM